MKYIFKFIAIPIYYLISRLFYLVVGIIAYLVYFVWHLKPYKIKARDMSDFWYLQIEEYYKIIDDEMKHYVLVYTSIKNFIYDVTTEIEL